MKQAIKGRLNTTKGRRSIFRGKRHVVSGLVTNEGRTQFRAAERRLRVVYKEVFGAYPPSVSAGDVVEFLARGEQETRRYLELQRAGAPLER